MVCIDNLKINKTSEIPIYRQVYYFFKSNIENGVFEKNTKLPPERELSKSLNISRGTVKKAYEILISDKLAYTQYGNGTFVSDLDTEKITSDLLENFILELKAGGLSINEVTALMESKIRSCFSKNKSVSVAIIDCNLESLSLIKRNLSVYEDLEIMYYLLDEVLDYTSPVMIFKSFDIILTTATHYNQLEELLYPIKEKIIKVVMSPDKKTFLKIANIKSSDHIGIFTVSKRFGEIINNNIKFLNIELKSENFVLVSEITSNYFKDFLKSKKILIIPPLFSMDFNISINRELLEFSKRGGEIIYFNYVIEEGSIIYIEEKIKEHSEITISN